MNCYDRTQIMLINTKFPLNINYLQKQDQTLNLGDMSWEDYEKFNSEEYQGYRISYFNGVITLVAPSKNHERIAQTIAILVSAYCRKFNLLYFLNLSNFIAFYLVTKQGRTWRIKDFCFS